MSFDQDLECLHFWFLGCETDEKIDVKERQVKAWSREYSSFHESYRWSHGWNRSPDQHQGPIVWKVAARPSNLDSKSVTTGKRCQKWIDGPLVVRQLFYHLGIFMLTLGFLETISLGSQTSGYKRFPLPYLSLRILQKKMKDV